MHKYERIGLWSLVILLLFLVLFKPRMSSGYSGPSINIMDLQEFRTVPTEIKTFYSNQFTRLFDTALTPVVRSWSTLPVDNKNKYKQMIKSEIDKRVALLEQSKSLTQTMSILSAPVIPTTKPQVQVPPNMSSGYEMFGEQLPEEEGYTTYFVR
jgi:hypothetical protein